MPETIVQAVTYPTLIDANTRVSELVIRVAGVWIYGLIDPLEPDRVRYVGKTAQPLARFTGHVFDKQTHGAEKREWHAELSAAGVLPRMLGLQYLTYTLLAKERERWWINHFRAMGQADLNRTLFRETPLLVARRQRKARTNG